MPQPNCVRCGSTSFNMKEMEVNDAAFRIMCVQCAKCGGVVGISDYYNVPALIAKLENKLKIRID